MAVERCHLLPAQDQQLGMPRLHFDQTVMVAGGVVIGDGDEVEAAPSGGGRNHVRRTRGGVAPFAGAREAIAVHRVRVQVALVPARPCERAFGRQRRGRRLTRSCRRQPNNDAVARRDPVADARDAHQ